MRAELVRARQILDAAPGEGMTLAAVDLATTMSQLAEYFGPDGTPLPVTPDFVLAWGHVTYNNAEILETWRAIGGDPSSTSRMSLYWSREPRPSGSVCRVRISGQHVPHPRNWMQHEVVMLYNLIQGRHPFCALSTER